MTWVREHESKVWHRCTDPSGEGDTVCGVVVPGSPYLHRGYLPPSPSTGCTECVASLAEPVTDEDWFLARNGHPEAQGKIEFQANREFAASLGTGRDTATRPEYVKCIRRPRRDERGQAWCGRAIGWDGITTGWEWAFDGLDYAAATGLEGGRLVPCEKCVQVAMMALAPERTLRVGAAVAKALEDGGGLETPIRLVVDPDMPPDQWRVEFRTP